MNGREYVLKAQVYVSYTDVILLCGKKILEQWGSKLDTRQSILETCLKRNEIVIHDDENLN